MHGLLEFDNGAVALVTELRSNGEVVAAHLSGPRVSAASLAKASDGPATAAMTGVLSGEPHSLRCQAGCLEPDRLWLMSLLPSR